MQIQIVRTPSERIRIRKGPRARTVWTYYERNIQYKVKVTF